MVARAKTKRMYRTMQGRMVDIEKLRATNENVQAVGNMNVNARGDVLGAGGQVVTPKSEVIKKYYEQPKGMVSDTPSKGKPMPAPKAAEPVRSVQKMTPVPKKETNTTTVFTPKAEIKPVETKTVEAVKPKTTSTAKKGIDAALDGLE